MISSAARHRNCNVPVVLAWEQTLGETGNGTDGVGSVGEG
jgi:hypothetical protein